MMSEAAPQSRFKTFGFPILFLMAVLSFVLLSRPELRGQVAEPTADAKPTLTIEAQAKKLEITPAAQRSPASVGSTDTPRVQIEPIFPQ
jgi:hypothetical protein